MTKLSVTMQRDPIALDWCKIENVLCCAMKIYEIEPSSDIRGILATKELNYESERLGHLTYGPLLETACRL